MNFQDLLERYDLPAIEQSSSRSRVSDGPDQEGGKRLRGKYYRRARVERQCANTPALLYNVS